ncbi:hypothetical protein EHQ52_17075 [Leptospira koniambonensis]|uniref:Uncharacterized protein n=1 Tax=Leptospira koniambonensis TaxID=2484950 RepID=A0A4R9J3L9_9LEPT|nr:hypothetical protein [Leptospira koniambonensis]TGL31639.1 hypothetical protein EHQ52_17075 [Leptospira koniambonensis]
MKNKIIGRKYQEFITPEYYRLEILDKAYYAFVITLVYSMLAFFALFSLSERGYIGRQTCVVLTLVCAFCILKEYWPIIQERYIQIDKDEIVMSPGVSFADDLRKLLWKDVIELQKIKFSFRGRYSFITTIEAYKFMFQGDVFYEIAYFDSPNFEAELFKFAAMNKVPFKINQ